MLTANYAPLPIRIRVYACTDVCASTIAVTTNVHAVSDARDRRRGPRLAAGPEAVKGM